MRAGVDFLQVADAHFGVDLRAIQLAVAEKLLDDADVGPVFGHVGDVPARRDAGRGGGPYGVRLQFLWGGRTGSDFNFFNKLLIDPPPFRLIH